MLWKTTEPLRLGKQGSLHCGTPGTTKRAITYFTGGDSITNFHIYELDWSPSSEQFLVDGQLYETQSVGAPFNAPFFFIMNLAVGGTLPWLSTTDSDINAANTFSEGDTGGLRARL